MTKPTTILLVFLLGARLSGQSVPELPVSSGERVRVTAPGVAAHPVTGRFLGLDSAALFVERDRPRGHVRLPLGDVTVVERSRGARRGSRALAGAGLGLLGGVVAGAIQATTNRRGDASFAPIGFGFYGMIGGAVVGALAAPERWEPAWRRP